MILSCLPVFLRAGVVPLKDGDIPGLVAGSSSQYTGDDFLQYRGSDAGLYLEYGFKNLLVQQLMLGNEEFRLEIFEMDSPEAAYGAYSVSVVRCNFRDTIADHDCQSRFHYLAAHGNLFIHITSVSGNPRIGSQLLSIAGAVIRSNPAAPFTLPEVFSQGRIQTSGKMIYFAKGAIGLQNCPFPWQDLMFGVRFSMYATLIPDQWGDIFFARITFREPGDMNRFLKAAGLMELNTPISSKLNAGIFREYQTTSGPLTILFLQSQQTISIRQVTGGF